MNNLGAEFFACDNIYGRISTKKLFFKRMKYGTRLEVFTGIAEQTRGGLRREDFVMGTNGRVASKKLSDYNKKRWAEGGKDSHGKVGARAKPQTVASAVLAADAADAADATDATSTTIVE